MNNLHTINRVENSAQIWAAKDGRVIPIRELTDEHISNILRYFDGRTVEIGSTRSNMLLNIERERERRQHEKLTSN